MNIYYNLHYSLSVVCRNWRATTAKSRKTKFLHCAFLHLALNHMT